MGKPSLGINNDEDKRHFITSRLTAHHLNTGVGPVHSQAEYLVVVPAPVINQTQSVPADTQLTVRLLLLLLLLYIVTIVITSIVPTIVTMILITILSPPESSPGEDVLEPEPGVPGEGEEAQLGLPGDETEAGDGLAGEAGGGVCQVQGGAGEEGGGVLVYVETARPVENICYKLVVCCSLIGPDN